jgi:hypothetical protein
VASCVVAVRRVVLEPPPQSLEPCHQCLPRCSCIDRTVLGHDTSTARLASDVSRKSDERALWPPEVSPQPLISITAATVASKGTRRSPMDFDARPTRSILLGPDIRVDRRPVQHQARSTMRR